MVKHACTQKFFIYYILFFLYFTKNVVDHSSHILINIFIQTIFSYASKIFIIKYTRIKIINLYLVVIIALK